MQVAEGQDGPEPKVVVRDRDTKFGTLFARVLRARGIHPMKLLHCSPDPNARTERSIQTICVKCLDKLIVLGTHPLDHLVAELMEHYSRERPHAGIGQRVPTGAGPPGAGKIVCRNRLGGAPRSYARAA